MEKNKKIILGVVSVIVIISVIVFINILVSTTLKEEVSNANPVENTRVEGGTETSTNLNNEEEIGSDVSTVYFTNDISSEGLLNIYHTLGFEPEGNVAIKLSTGEMGGDYYLHLV